MEESHQVRQGTSPDQRAQTQGPTRFEEMIMMDHYVCFKQNVGPQRIMNKSVSFL